MRIQLRLALFSLLSVMPMCATFSYTDGDHAFSLSNTLLIEGFGGHNLNLLNDNNITSNCDSLDKVVIPGQHTWDMRLAYGYGYETYNRTVSQAKVGLRNKGIWGAPESISSTKDADIKFLEVKTGSHKHDIPVHMVTLREVWLSMELSAMTGLCMDTGHVFKLGLFPFTLGRGIALGPAYKVVPDLIGYKPIDSVQQFAPGFLLSGPIFDQLSYDFYGSILENKSDSFSRVNEKNRGQEIGRLESPARGSGVFNYIVAGRFKWTPINEADQYAYFEPYGMYNRQDEQKVEFVGDATLDLGTFGLATEIQAGNFEFGFDTAFNIGKQHVKAWDRNAITFENFEDGILRTINNEVTDRTSGGVLQGEKAPYKPGSPAQKNIYGQTQNLSQIDNVAALNNMTFEFYDENNDLRTFENSKKRFRNAYTNDLEGSMFVCDAAYRFSDCVKWAVSGGFATGDENPNRDVNERGESERDGSFGGFLGLQEIYSGKRVRSYMVMSGFGRFPRVASFPNREVRGNRFADRVSRFADLQFIGTALWIDTETEGSWRINPNILSFWKHNTTKIFDPEINERGEKEADDHLGVELNTAIEGYPFPHVKFFVISGVFVPGDHYDDIKGRPINKDQEKFLDRQDATGFEDDPQPLLGNDTGWFINAGFEYRF